MALSYNELKAGVALANYVEPVLTNTQEKTGDRTHSIRYTYNNKYRVIVTTSYYKAQKMYRTAVSLVEVEFAEHGFVIEKSIGSIFNHRFVNHIAHSLPVPRYSEKAFAESVRYGIRHYTENYRADYVADIAELLSGKVVTE